MWIDLAGAGVLVCDLGGAWMNREHSLSRRGDEDSNLTGAIVGSMARSLSLSICASVSPSFSPSFSLCAFLEMV